MNNEGLDSLMINIACGDIYVDGWTNLDYLPHSNSVIKCNLLSRLPLADGVADVVYSSHFLEHIPRAKVGAFLTECFRILKPSGTIRLVTPDLEELCREYLFRRESGEHEKANFVVLLMLDQCVRQDAGGELGRFYEHIAWKGGPTLTNYVFELTGRRIQPKQIPTAAAQKRSFLNRAFSVLRHPGKMTPWLESRFRKAVLSLLSSAFREQNISLASVGERHMWLYDFIGLAELLSVAGFTDVEKLNFNLTKISGFPLIPLDMAAAGTPRKGKQSLYVEARRPAR